MEAPTADASAMKRCANADYLIIAPEEFVESLAPLVAHREGLGHTVASLSIEEIYRLFSKGKPSAEAIREAITQIDKQGGRLRFLFLVGDVNARDEMPTSVSLPTHYVKKVEYEHHRADEHDHEFPFERGDHNHENEEYPTDRPYGLLSATRRISVGRLPARTPGEVRGYVQKIIKYETQRAAGAWQRKLIVTAGAANFGALADAAIEGIATDMLDAKVSYDFDIRFTFAKEGSPYASRLDQLPLRWRSELESGALIATYVGHGSFYGFDDTHFRDRHYFIGTRNDASFLNVQKGNPFFLSITCNTGAFDLADGSRSMAEALVMNPSGAIAVYAATRETHPYPNALLGEAVIEQFINQRPRTIGEGLLEVMSSARKASIPLAELLVQGEIEPLKEEHEGLYNLLGDPATRLQYARAVALQRTDANSDLKPKAKFSIDADLASTSLSGRALFTLETQRSVIRGVIAEPEVISAMPTARAFGAMDTNWQRANDKVIATKEVEVVGGKARVEFSAPSTPGRYLVKVFVEGDKSAAGHIAFNVK